MPCRMSPVNNSFRIIGPDRCRMPGSLLPTRDQSTQHVSGHLLNPHVFLFEVPLRRIDEYMRSGEDHVPPAGPGVKDNIALRALVNDGRVGLSFRLVTDRTRRHDDQTLYL